MPGITLTGRRGTEAQGTLGHCSTVGTAGTSSPASSCPVHGAATGACGLCHFPLFLSSTPPSFLIHSNSFMKAFSCPGCSRRQQGPLCPLSEQRGLSSCTVTRPGGLSQARTEISGAHLSSPHSIQSWCVSVCTHEN